jgi:hypothetical protein
MTAFDWTLIYLSVGLAFGVFDASTLQNRGLSGFSNVILLVVLWPFFALQRLLIDSKAALGGDKTRDSRKSEVREKFARILESETPGISIVRSRETIDWYLELAESVAGIAEGLNADRVERVPELAVVSGKSPNSVAPISLERRALRKAAKHLDGARNSLIESILGNPLIQPFHQMERTLQLTELAELVGDSDGMKSGLDRLRPSAERELVAAIEAPSQETA